MDRCPTIHNCRRIINTLDMHVNGQVNCMLVAMRKISVGSEVDFSDASVWSSIWLALLCHPDKNPGRVDEASVRMAAINEAFATIIQDSKTSALTLSTRNYTTQSSSVKTASKTTQSDPHKVAITNKINLLSSLKCIGSCIYKVGRLAEVTAGKPRKEDALWQVVSRLQRLTLQIYLGGLGLEHDEAMHVRPRRRSRTFSRGQRIHDIYVFADWMLLIGLWCGRKSCEAKTMNECKW